MWNASPAVGAAWYVKKGATAHAAALASAAGSGRILRHAHEKRQTMADPCYLEFCRTRDDEALYDAGADSPRRAAGTREQRLLHLLQPRDRAAMAGFMRHRSSVRTTTGARTPIRARAASQQRRQVRQQRGGVRRQHAGRRSTERIVEQAFFISRLLAP